MTQRLNDIIDEIVNVGSNFAASLGINRVAGQLYILLYLNENPLSLDEMTSRLKISKGHVSTNIRALERWQAVRRIWVKGSRKDFYQANTDTLKIIVNQLKYGLDQRFDELEKGIIGLKGKIADKSLVQIESREAKNLEQKLKQIESMYRKVKALLDKVSLINFLS